MAETWPPVETRSDTVEAEKLLKCEIRMSGPRRLKSLREGTGVKSGDL